MLKILVTNWLWFVNRNCLLLSLAQRKDVVKIAINLLVQMKKGKLIFKFEKFYEMKGIVGFYFLGKCNFDEVKNKKLQKINLVLSGSTFKVPNYEIMCS